MDVNMRLNCEMYLWNAIAKLILRREESRAQHRCSEEGRICLPAVRDEMLQDRASTSRLAPDRDLFWIPTKF